MKYKYYDKRKNLLAESDSPIKFNEKLFPIFKDLEPAVEKTKKISFYEHKEEEEN